MPPNSSQEIFALYDFVEQMYDTLTTPLAVDGHISHVNQRNDTERRSKEAGLCNNDLVFLTCGGLHNYESMRTVAVGEKLAC